MGFVVVAKLRRTCKFVFRLAHHLPAGIRWNANTKLGENEMMMSKQSPRSGPSLSKTVTAHFDFQKIKMRKHSVSAQLTRTARRFSTVIAPQLTKLEPVMVLQKHLKLRICIADITKLQEAIKQYVLHNGRLFDPVEFEVRSEEEEGGVVLTALFYAEEIVLFDGNKRLLSISMTDPSEADLINRFNASGVPQLGEGPVLAKVRHPISGIKMFEVVQSNQRPHERWHITGAMDELNKCEIETHSNLWRQILSACGFVFASEWWSVQHEGLRVAQICPRKAVCEENSLRLEWSESVNNELRLLTLCFGLVQTVREAFPSLMHIVKEHRQRKMQIHHPQQLAGGAASP